MGNREQTRLAAEGHEARVAADKDATKREAARWRAERKADRTRLVVTEDRKAALARWRAEAEHARVAARAVSL